MVAESPNSLASPLLDPPGQLDCAGLPPTAESQASRALALPPLPPTSPRVSAALGAAKEDVPGLPQVLPRPGMETASQLAAPWHSIDRRPPKDWLRGAGRNLSAEEGRLADEEAQFADMEVAYQVGFPSDILSEFRLVSNGRLITEINYDKCDGGGSPAASSSQAPSEKRSTSGINYARVFSGDAFSNDLALALLRAGIAGTALFMNAAVLLAVSSSAPAGRTVKYFLGCLCAVSAVIQFGVASRVVRHELAARAAKAKSNDLDPLMSLLVWGSRILFVLLGVPGRVKNVLFDIHPCRDRAGGFGIAALEDRGSQVFITCHSCACEFFVVDAYGRERMTPVQMCMAMATTLCKLVLALLEPGFGVDFLVLSICPSTASIVRDVLSFRKLKSERKQFRQWLLRRHSSAHAQESRLAAQLLKDHFGEAVDEQLPTSEPSDHGSPPKAENDAAAGQEQAAEDMQLRQTCWELVKEMQVCLDKGDQLPSDLQAARDRLTSALLSRQAAAGETAGIDNVRDQEQLSDGTLNPERGTSFIRERLTNGLFSLQAKSSSVTTSEHTRNGSGELPDDLEAVCERFAGHGMDHPDGYAPGLGGTLTLTRSSRGADIQPAIIYSGIVNNASRENLLQSSCYEEDRDDFTSLSASMATFATNEERASSHVLAMEREDLALQLHAARDALAQEVCAGAELRSQLACAQLELKDYRQETERLMGHLQNSDPPSGQTSRTCEEQNSVSDSISTFGSRGLPGKVDKIMSDVQEPTMLFSQTCWTPRMSADSVSTRMKDMKDLMQDITSDEAPERHSAGVNRDAMNSMSTLSNGGYSSNGTMPPWSENFQEAWRRLASLRSSLSPSTTLQSSDANVGVPEATPPSSVVTPAGDAAAGVAAPVASPEDPAITISPSADRLNTTLSQPRLTLSPDKSEAETVAESSRLLESESGYSKKSPVLSSRLSPCLSDSKSQPDSKQSPALSNRSARIAEVDPPEVSLEQVMLGENLRRRTEPAQRTFSLISQAENGNAVNLSSSSEAAGNFAPALAVSPASPAASQRSTLQPQQYRSISPYHGHRDVTPLASRALTPIAKRAASPPKGTPRTISPLSRSSAMNAGSAATSVGAASTTATSMPGSSAASGSNPASGAMPPFLRMGAGIPGSQPGMAVPIVQQRSPQLLTRSTVPCGTFPYKQATAMPSTWGTLNAGLATAMAAGTPNTATTPTMLSRDIAAGTPHFSAQAFSPTLPLRQASGPAAHMLSPRV